MVGRCGVHPGQESECSHLHTFHRNHPCCGICSSARGNIMFTTTFVYPGTLLSERQSTYYTDASDVFTVVSMPLAVTWQAFALLTEEKSPATHLQWEQKCQFSVK